MRASNPAVNIRAVVVVQTRSAVKARVRETLLLQAAGIRVLLIHVVGLRNMLVSCIYSDYTVVRSLYTLAPTCEVSTRHVLAYELWMYLQN